MTDRAGAQPATIKAVMTVLTAARISAWLFGGWGLDAKLVRISREHGDIEFWLEGAHADRSKAVLARRALSRTVWPEAAAAAPATSPC
jgi:HD-like signal output (HDOD) protein